VQDHDIARPKVKISLNYGIILLIESIHAKQVTIVKIEKLFVMILTLLMTVVVTVVISIFLTKDITPDDLSPVKNQTSLTVGNVKIITMSSNFSNRVVENVQLVINQGLNHMSSQRGEVRLFLQE